MNLLNFDVDKKREIITYMNFEQIKCRNFYP